MRVLICTHHVHEWAGSELVALELVEGLAARGAAVTLFAPFLDPVFTHAALGPTGRWLNDPRRVDMGEYDLMVTLHQAASRFLHLQDADRLTDANRPVFAYLHLSPTEPFEAPGVVAQPAFADLTYANSAETRDALTDLGLRDVLLFENPAPAAFASDTAAPKRLTRLLSVSSHLPTELAAAFDILETEGVEVYRIGAPHNPRRVRPHDLFDHDAVVTIGKTVQYALRARRPVFCYDIHHGPGWLRGDPAETIARNFSGRCHPMRRDGPALAAEIRDGYVAARDWAAQTQLAQADRYRLGRQVDDLLSRAHAIRCGRASRQRVADPVALLRDLRKEAATHALADREYETRTRILAPVVPRHLAPAADHPAVTRHHVRDPEPGQPMVVAAFSYRFDAHLVADLIANIGPSIHGYVAFDDSAAPADDSFTDETARQSALFEAASAMGADWLFAVDPDERFEDRLADRIGAMTRDHGPVIWSFDCREMFDANRYRTDGIWGQRSRARLFPCLKGMEPDRQALHGNWTRNALRLPVKPSGLNFYHLRMAHPARRRLRRLQYARLDPTRDSQSLGYDYLDDDRGACLREIPDGRGYTPAFVEDGGMWADAGPADQARAVAPDPLKARLRRMTDSYAKGGYAAGMVLARDMAAERKDDPDLALWAADCALRAGEWTVARDLASPIARADPEALMARLILARAAGASGDGEAANHALVEAEALLPGSLECARTRDRLRPAPARFQRDDAAWRAWLTGPAQLREGRRIAPGDLTVVVISLGAPPELTDAVTSLFRQSVVPEIVVVNSGGGDAAARLGAQLDRVRLIEIEERLFAGAARNVGIDAGTGRFVAFLAADCTAEPGSMARRLSLHRAGARAVAAYVLPQDEARVTQAAASLLLHPGRHPVSGVLERQGYSLSYARDLFDDFGYFPPGLRIGEDTQLNHAIAQAVEIETHPAIVIRHAYADDPDELIADIARRSRRRVRHLFYGLSPTHQALRQKVNDGYDSRLRLSLAAFERRRGELGPGMADKVHDLLLRALEAERRAAFETGQVLHAARGLQLAAMGCGNGDADTALTLIGEAVGMLPGSASLQQTLAEVLMRQDTAEARAAGLAAYRRAAGIDPTNATRLMLAQDQLIAAGDAAGAVTLFEQACLIAPRQPAILSRHAPFPGDGYRPLRVMSLQRMFFLNPFDENITRTLAANYAHAGNDGAHKARLRMAEALQD